MLVFAYGDYAKRIVGMQNLADLIGAEPKDIIFTSGATETNNMAIKGVARFHKEKKRHIITTQTVRDIQHSAAVPSLTLSIGA